MKLFRLEYQELPGLSDGVLELLADYFSEHDTGGEGIIASIDDNVVEDILNWLDCHGNDEAIASLKKWWEDGFSPTTRKKGFDFQLLTNA